MRKKGKKTFKTARNNKTRTKMLIIRTFVSIAGLNVKGINYPTKVTKWQNRKKKTLILILILYIMSDKGRDGKSIPANGK